MWNDFNFSNAKYQQYLLDMAEIQYLESFRVPGQWDPELEMMLDNLYKKWVD